MIKILFICHGNICRSPMAEFVLKDMVREMGAEAQFRIESAATSREEIGNPVHRGTREVLKRHGIAVGQRAARQMTKQDYEEYDYLIGMDQWNIRNMLRITGGDPDGKIYKLMEFAEAGGSGPGSKTGVGKPGSKTGGSESGSRRETGTTEAAADVADPWYTGDFETTYRDVTSGCRGFLERLADGTQPYKREWNK